MATWNSGESNRRHQLTRRVVRLSMVSIGSSVAIGYIVLGLTGWVAPPRTAAQAPAAVDAQTVQYPSGGAMIEAYIARPKGAAKSPAVILVHDDLGLNKAFRDLTQQFAQEGFVAMAPNLPSRSKTAAVEESPAAVSLRRTPVDSLMAAQTVDDVKAAFAFLAKDPGVDPARISAVGVGWGEYRVWRLAEDTPSLYRAVVYYGIEPSDDDRLRAIKIPVLGHYAEQDYLATARVLKTKKLLGEKFTYFIYPTVPGFFGGGSGQLQPEPGASGRMILRRKQPQAAAAAGKQAWTRTLDFLRKG